MGHPVAPVPEEKICQVCGEALEGKTVVACNRCATLHHAECWRYNRGCAVFACGCRACREVAEESMPEGVFELKQPYHPGQLVALLIALPAMLMAFAMDWLLATVGVAGFAWGVLPAFFGLVVLTLFLDAKGERVLLFDGERRALTRQFRISGRVVREDRDALEADRVVEVHLHQYRTEGNPWRFQELHLALDDGSRELLLRSRSAGGDWDPALEAQAEKIAAWADTTVRVLESAQAPDAAEMKALAEGRRRELAERERLALAEKTGADVGDGEGD